MKILLSLAGLLIAGVYLLSGPITTTYLIAGSLFMALCLLGLIFFWGRSDPKPLIGDVGYLDGNAVTVVAVFESFFNIPETIKLIHQPDLDTDRDITRPWVVAIDKRGRAWLSPYFKPVKSCNQQSKPA